MGGIAGTYVTGTLVYDVESSTWFNVGGPSWAFPLTAPIDTVGPIFKVMMIGGGTAALSASNQVYMF